MDALPPNGGGGGASSGAPGAPPPGKGQQAGQRGNAAVVDLFGTDLGTAGMVLALLLLGLLSASMNRSNCICL
jgi:hypothetical protein